MYIHVTLIVSYIGPFVNMAYYIFTQITFEILSNSFHSYFADTWNLLVKIHAPWRRQKWKDVQWKGKNWQIHFSAFYFPCLSPPLKITIFIGLLSENIMFLATPYISHSLRLFIYPAVPWYLVVKMRALRSPQGVKLLMGRQTLNAAGGTATY